MKVLCFIFSVAIGLSALSARAADFTEVRIDVIVGASNSRNGRAIFDGARAAAKDLGLSVDTLGAPSAREPAQQAQLVKNAVATKPTAIVVAPSNARALAEPIARATRAGIPVVVLDTPPETKNYATLLAPDDEAMGKKAADAMVRCIKNRHEKMAGSIVYLAELPPASSRDTRTEGFAAGLKRYPHLEVVPRKTDSDDMHRMLSGSDRSAAKHGDLAGIVVGNGAKSADIVRAMPHEANARHTCVVAFGVSRAEIALLQSGAIDALIVRNPYMMGYAGIWYALAAARGVVLPRQVDVPVHVVTRANMDAPKTAELLDPQKYALMPFLGGP